MQPVQEPKAKDLTFDEIQAAYEKLEHDELALLNAQVDLLIDKIKARNPRISFGKQQALELLSKLGIWTIGKRVIR